jgi:hypothetical protein
MPLVVSNANLSWKRDRDMFSLEWLKKNNGEQTVRLFDADHAKELAAKPLREFVDTLVSSLASSSSSSATTGTIGSTYAHSIACPPAWRDYLTQKLPNYFCKCSNDLEKDLMTELQVDTTTINVGHHGLSSSLTSRSLASISHSLMLWSEEQSYALWFVIAPANSSKVLDYLSDASLCGDTLAALASGSSPFGPEPSQLVIEIESLAKLGCTISVIEQREGDWILMPSDSIFEVFNRNGRSVRVNWDIIAPHSIVDSYRVALPRARFFGRAEQFRLKATAYHALLNRIEIFENQSKPDVETLVQEFPPLMTIVEELIHQEWIQQLQPQQKKAAAKKAAAAAANDKSQMELDKLRFIDDKVPHQRICQFCRCDIFNRCYHCSKCGVSGLGYDICLDCVAEGRSCSHKSELRLFEYMSQKQIRQTLDKAKEVFDKILKSAKRKQAKRKVSERKAIFEWAPTTFPIDIYSSATIAHKVAQTWKQEVIA